MSGIPATTRRRARDTAELVAAMRRGDLAARREFYERYRSQAERSLRRRLGSFEDLEDLVHEVLLQAMLKVGQLRSPDALGAWVDGIAGIAAKRCRKSEFRRPWQLTPLGTLPDLAGTGSDQEVREAFTSMRRLLGLLNGEERWAVLLWHVEELTVDEASRSMGLTPSTFKRRLRRGQHRLLRLARGSAALEAWLPGSGNVTSRAPAPRRRSDESMRS